MEILYVIAGIIVLIVAIMYILAPLKLWSIDGKMDKIIELLEKREKK